METTTPRNIYANLFVQPPRLAINTAEKTEEKQYGLLDFALGQFDLSTEGPDGEPKGPGVIDETA